MEHWPVTYLGIRQIPRELTEFDLATFFTFSAKERALIEARRGGLCRDNVEKMKYTYMIRIPALSKNRTEQRLFVRHRRPSFGLS
jgi:hypothetical protein